LTDRFTRWTLLFPPFSPPLAPQSLFNLPFRSPVVSWVSNPFHSVRLSFPECAFPLKVSCLFSIWPGFLFKFYCATPGREQHRNRIEISPNSRSLYSFRRSAMYFFGVSDEPFLRFFWDPCLFLFNYYFEPKKHFSTALTSIRPLFLPPCPPPSPHFPTVSIESPPFLRTLYS